MPTAISETVDRVSLVNDKVNSNLARIFYGQSGDNNDRFEDNTDQIGKKFVRRSKLMIGSPGFFDAGIGI